MPKKYDDIEAIAAKESFASWLKSLREGASRKNGLYGLARFLRWRKSKGLQSDPDLLIKECLDGTNRTLLDHTKLLNEWCQGDDHANAAPATIFRSCGIVRSFYAHHMVALPRARLRIPRQVGAEVKTEMTADEYLRVFRRAISTASVRDRSVMLTALQTGCDTSTISRVFNLTAYGQLVAHFGTEDWRRWETSLCPVRVDLVRPKTSYRYYTFVDADGVEALRDWLNVTRYPPRLLPNGNPSMFQRSTPIYVDLSTNVGGPLAPLAISSRGLNVQL